MFACNEGLPAGRCTDGRSLLLGKPAPRPPPFSKPARRVEARARVARKRREAQQEVLYTVPVVPRAGEVRRLVACTASRCACKACFLLRCFSRLTAFEYLWSIWVGPPGFGLG